MANEQLLGISQKAIEQADLAKLLVSVLVRLRKLEEEVGQLWREVHK